jgi:membrane-associated protease RseP (regulator of RpoE activity)
LVATAVWSTFLVHELVHVLSARYFGVRVLKVSLGVGREIVGFSDRYGTRWSIGVIPYGSYHKLVGESGASSELDAAAKESGSLLSVSRARRAAIYSAGPAANIMQAPVMYFLAQLLLAGALSWPKPNDVASALALTLGLYSLSIGVICLLPIPPSDGGNLFKLFVDDIFLAQTRTRLPSIGRLKLLFARKLWPFDSRRVMPKTTSTV